MIGNYATSDPSYYLLQETEPSVPQKSLRGPCDGKLEQFNFEMRGNSRFICRNRCRSHFPARYFAVDKDILLHLKVELL